jgi:hypothetical protein
MMQRGRSDSFEPLGFYVSDDEWPLWPPGWTEGTYYLPLLCPSCDRLRLRYATPTEQPQDGILVRCEKCGAASFNGPNDPAPAR